MSKRSKVKQGRNNWIETAVERGNTLRYLRKENNRIKKERDQYKSSLNETE